MRQRDRASGLCPTVSAAGRAVEVAVQSVASESPLLIVATWLVLLGPLMSIGQKTSAGFMLQLEMALWQYSGNS